MYVTEILPWLSWRAPTGIRAVAEIATVDMTGGYIKSNRGCRKRSQRAEWPKRKASERKREERVRTSDCAS